MLLMRFETDHQLAAPPLTASSFFNLCLPNEFSHFHMTVVKQDAPLDTNCYVLFKLVDFYPSSTLVQFHLSNFW